MHINEHKAGLTFGIFLGVAHVVWSIVVALGWGDDLLKFGFWAHMVHPQGFTVGPFDLGTSLLLIVVAVCVGYVIGRVVATIWNKVHRGR